MDWKKLIKSWIPILPLPCFKRHKAQILEFSRDDYYPGRIFIADENLPYYFRPADFEKDLQDIVDSYPDELDLTDKEERARVISDRFKENCPCFVVREKGSESLFGAMWAKPGGYPFLTSDRSKYEGKTIFTLTNSFVIPEKRGSGLGKFLKFRTLAYLFSDLSADYIHSLVQEYRLPSLIPNLKAGFSVVGTLFDQNIFGTTIEHFYRINTNPFFSTFAKVPVVVVASDGSNPLGIARSLGRKKIPVYVLSLDQARAMKHSRYVKNIVPVSSLEDSEEVKSKLEELLQKISTDTSFAEESETGKTPPKPILVPTNELHYHRFLPIADFINENFEMMTPLEKATHLAEKHQQFPHAEKAGFRVLDTIILKTPEEVDSFREDISFPVIVRPGLKSSRKELIQKTELYHSYSELKESLRPILEKNEADFIVQEYVPGNDENVVFFMASCLSDGTPRAWFCGKKIRQFPPGRGLMASGIVDSDPDPVFVQKCKHLCRSFGLRGFIGIECKKHPDTGEYFYIESSIRPEGDNSIGLAAGVDLVLDSYLSVLNFPCGIVRKERLKGSWAWVELEHASARSMRRSGDRNWWKVFLPLPRPISYAFFTWDDPLPFFYSFGRLAALRLKKLFGRGKKKS